MMIVQEYLLMGLVGLVGVIVSSLGTVTTMGINRLIKSHDDLAFTLTEIQKQVTAMNGRMGKAETWMTLHHEADAQQFTELKTKDLSIDKLIKLVETLRRESDDPLRR